MYGKKLRFCFCFATYSLGLTHSANITAMDDIVLNKHFLYIEFKELVQAW